MARTQTPLPAGWVAEGRRTLGEYLDVELRKYRHEKYGTGVVLAEVQGPICGVSMQFATEAKNDKGLPHCLEHLCFFESKRYPRGVLDLLATRCGSHGTNASTDFDHTDYEFEVAGQAGLLKILPVFLHHVLAPSLAQSHFTTEVFHVNGKGQNQGVVYSEMVGRCNGESDLLWNTLLKATFGEGSAYSFECGGKPEEIAKLTRKEIAKYHEEVYTTDNLHVMITGRIDTNTVLECVSGALDHAVADGASVKCVDRPFTKKLPTPQHDTRRCVVFPSDDTSVGTYMYAVRLPYSLYDTEAGAATDILLRYLTDLSSSPLNQAFVELADPIASSISADRQATVEPYFHIEFSGVPYEGNGAAFQPAGKHGQAATAAEEDPEDEEDEEGEEDEEAPEEEAAGGGRGGGDAKMAANVASSGAAAASRYALPQAEGVDYFSSENAMIERVLAVLTQVEADIRGDGDACKGEWRALRDAIDKERISRVEEYEESPHNTLIAVLPELLFASYPHTTTNGAPEPNQDFGASMDDTAAFEALLRKPATWWADLLHAQIIAPIKAAMDTGKGAVEVRSIPDAKLAKYNEKQADRQTAANKKKYGKDGLAKLKKTVEAAEEKNKINLSDAVKTAFPGEIQIGDVADMPRTMNLHRSTQSGVQEGHSPPTSDVEFMDLAVQTFFVDLRAYFDFSSVPARLRRYLNLFASLLMQSNVNGRDYREVVAALDRDMVTYNCAVSRFGRYMSPGTQPQLVCIYLNAVPDKADKLATWLSDLLGGVEFTEEKVRSQCKHMLAEISEDMRCGSTVLEHCVSQASFDPDSQQFLLSPFAQRNFLKRALQNLGETVARLQELLSLLQSEDIPVSALIAGRDRDIRDSVRSAVAKVLATRARPPVFSALQWGAGSADKRRSLQAPRAFAVGVGGCDAAYISIDAPVNVTPSDKKEYWALRLLCAAVSIGEGDLTLAIRGKGLAYGAGLYFHSYQSTVSLEVWECTNVKEALESAMEVLMAIPDEEASSVLSDFNIRNSIGSMVYGIKAKRETPSDIIDSATTACMKGIFTQAAEEEDEAILHTLTREDLLAAYENHVKPALITQHPALVAGVVCDPQHVPANAKHLAAALSLPVGSHKSIKVLYDVADKALENI